MAVGEGAYGAKIVFFFSFVKMENHFELVLSLINIKLEENGLLSYAITNFSNLFCCALHLFVAGHTCPFNNNIPTSQV